MTLIQFFRTFAISAAALLMLVGTAPAAESSKPSSQGGQCLVYVGTYTGPKSKGIYVYRLNLATGALTSLGLAGEATNPSFLALHPNHRFLYAAGEVGSFEGKPSGSVDAFAINAESGKLTLLNRQPSIGSGPCHLVVDRAGKTVLVANYGGGSTTALSVREDGRLGDATAFIQHTGSSANPRRQEGPHAHGIYLDAANHFAFVPDLGLDKVLIYRFDATKGSLAPNDPPAASINPGSGPRHFAIHPSGRYAYVINEIVCTVTAFGLNSERGELKEIQTLSTLPDGESVKPSYSTAELFVHPSGKFLYGSNRGHHSIVGYAIDEKTGKLTRLENVSTQGKTPRSFGIDPTGTFLLAANQDTHNIVVFRINPKTGRLSSTGNSVEAPSPVCVAFLPVKP